MQGEGKLADNHQRLQLTARSVCHAIAKPRKFASQAVLETNNQVDVKGTGKDDRLYRMIELELKAYEPAVLQSYEWFATTAAKHLDITVGNCWSPPKPLHERRSLLKSVHIYKKHMVQYEVRTYFKFLQFKYLTGSTADTFLEYIERNLPEGVGMKVTKIQVEKLRDHWTNETNVNNRQV